MSGGLSARGLARAYQRGRERVRHLARERIDQMKTRVVTELRKDREARRSASKKET
jgi:hypothetical protein